MLSRGIAKIFLSDYISGMEDQEKKLKNGRKGNPGRPKGDRPPMPRKSIRLSR